MLYYPNQLPQTEPENLLLTTLAFPDAWTANDVQTYRVAENFIAASDGVSVRLDHPNNFPQVRRGLAEAASHTIGNYRSIAFAHLDFVWQSDYWFKSESYNNWQIPADISEPSMVADEYQFGCAFDDFSGSTRCVMIARYGQYLSEFWVKTDAGKLSDADLQKVLTAIDQQFVDMGVK